eukprot:2180259-Amphidinium_carterae.1
MSPTFVQLPQTGGSANSPKLDMKTKHNIQQYYNALKLKTKDNLGIRKPQNSARDVESGCSRTYLL